MIRPFLLLAVALAACGPSRQAADDGPGVTLSVDPTTTRPGGSVSLLLRNGSDGAVGYNLCTSGLERRSEAGWVAVPAERVCTMELRTLTAGAEDRYSMELPEGLAPGEYRFHTAVETMETGERREVRSGPFEVSS